MSFLEAASVVIRQTPTPKAIFCQGGDLKAISASLSTLVGMDEETLVGEGMVGAFHPLDRNAWSEFWCAFLQTESRRLPTLRLQHRGTEAVHWVELTPGPLRDLEDRVCGYVMQVYDVTQLRAQALEAEERSRLVEITDAQASIGHWRLHTKLQHLAWSRQVHAIHGTDPGKYEPRLEEAIDFYHPEDRDRIRSAVTESLETHQTMRQEARIIRPSGEIRWVRAWGSPFRYVDLDGQIYYDLIGIFQDITDEQMLLQRLAESEERYALATSAARGGIWDWDLFADTLFWSDRVFELLGLLKEDFQGKSSDFLDRIHPEDRARTSEALQAHLQRGRPFEVEHRIQHAGGHYLWIATKGKASFDKEGKPNRLVGTVSDIDEMVQSRHLLVEQSEEIAQQSERIRQSSRDIERFAAIASHDMREPLRKIQWFASLLEEREVDLTDRSRRDLASISKAATHLYEMVGELLEFAKAPMTRNSKESIDLDQLVAEVIALQNATLQESGGSIEVAPLPTVQGNRAKLRVVFTNLISNALKYRKKDAPPRVKIATRPVAGEKVLIEVSDQGIGFAPGDEDKIFTLFERLHGKGKYPGHGLGLAVVRKIVEEHSGRVWAEGELGVGASVFVELPTPVSAPGARSHREGTAAN